MNTALLSIDRAAALGFAFTHSTSPSRTARPRTTTDTIFNQLSAFCTRVLLLGGRSPLNEPMLSRVLLAAYAGGGLAALATDAELDTHTRLTLAIRLLREALQMSLPEAGHHAAALVSPAADASPRLREIMQRGARAFARWQAGPAEFRPADFREPVATTAARPLPH